MSEDLFMAEGQTISQLSQPRQRQMVLEVRVSLLNPISTSRMMP